MNNKITDERIVIWGFGNYLENVIEKINPDLTIIAISDKDKSKQGRSLKYGNRQLICKDWEALRSENITKVLVALRNVDSLSEIKNAIHDDDIVVEHINSEINKYREIWEKIQIQKYDKKFDAVNMTYDDRIKCFLSLTVPIDYCNLQCSYCYVGQHNDFYKKGVKLYSAEFLRRAFSKKRIGGIALINLCGTGETCLCNGLVNVVNALLEEGHYISIITNALIEKSIKELIKDKNSERLFFKCSFHYAELKRKGLLEKYVSNVKSIIDSKASCSIELVPHDEIIDEIDEIKDFCVRNFGAWPHVTVARNESVAGYPILSEKTYEEYKKTWGAFNSQLFEVKMRHQSNENQYCIAGRGTMLIDLEHGGSRYCPNNGTLNNVYDNIDEPIRFSEIGTNCKSSYCVNSHAYLTLGMISDLKEVSYLQVRDRECVDERKWIKDPVKKVFSQRICDNLER